MADLSGLLQQFVQQPTGFQGISQGLQGLGQLLGQQYMQKQADERELANAIALARQKAMIEQQFRSPLEELINRGKAVESAVSMGDINLANRLRRVNQRGNTQPTLQGTPGTAQQGQPIGSTFGRFQPVMPSDNITGEVIKPRKFNVFGEPTEFSPESVEEKKFKLEEIQSQELNKKATENLISSVRSTLDNISEVEKGIENFGLFGAFPSVPGTKRVLWESNFRKLTADKVLDVLKNLKEASKTGATGFGQLSNKELGILQDSATTLKRTLSQEDARDILNKMKPQLMKILGDQQSTGDDFSSLWEDSEK